MVVYFRSAGLNSPARRGKKREEKKTRDFLQQSRRREKKRTGARRRRADSAPAALGYLQPVMDLPDGPRVRSSRTSTRTELGGSLFFNFSHSPRRVAPHAKQHSPNPAENTADPARYIPGAVEPPRRSRFIPFII